MHGSILSKRARGTSLRNQTNEGTLTAHHHHKTVVIMCSMRGNLSVIPVVSDIDAAGHNVGTLARDEIGRFVYMIVSKG
jgi:hypothetical protein